MLVIRSAACNGFIILKRQTHAHDKLDSHAFIVTSTSFLVTPPSLRTRHRGTTSYSRNDCGWQQKTSETCSFQGMLIRKRLVQLVSKQNYETNCKINCPVKQRLQFGRSCGWFMHTGKTSPTVVGSTSFSGDCNKKCCETCSIQGMLDQAMINATCASGNDPTKLRDKLQDKLPNVRVTICHPLLSKSRSFSTNILRSCSSSVGGVLAMSSILQRIRSAHLRIVREKTLNGERKVVQSEKL